MFFSLHQVQTRVCCFSVSWFCSCFFTIVVAKFTNSSHDFSNFGTSTDNFSVTSCICWIYARDHSSKWLQALQPCFVCILCIHESTEPHCVHLPHMRRSVYAHDSCPDTSAQFHVLVVPPLVQEPQVHSTDVHIHSRLRVWYTKKCLWPILLNLLDFEISNDDLFHGVRKKRAIDRNPPKSWDKYC